MVTRPNGAGFDPEDEILTRRHKSAIAGLVLAGGRSSRFGADKSFARLAGMPLVEHVAARLRPQVGTLAISANRDADDYGAIDAEVIADTVAGYAGPLAGILAGLRWVRTAVPEARFLATAAVDTPFFPPDCVERLLAAAAKTDRIAMAASARGTHPIFAVWPIGAEQALADYLAQGKRAVHRWMEEQRATAVSFAEIRIGSRAIDPFFNINEPEDLQAAEGFLTDD